MHTFTRISHHDHKGMLQLFVLFCLAASVHAADNPPKLRLSEVENIQPTGYKVDLALDPAKNTFSGTIIIRMDIKEPVQTIWLNQEKIQIQSATLAEGGKTLRATTVPGGDDYVGLRFESIVSAGQAVATLQYTGIVEEKNSSAIFRQQDSGNWYIFSQFEPTDARGAFPCFDEPAYKTPWQLTLHVPANVSAISNTPVLSETQTGGGMKTVVFKETKPLPSHLVAFAVGPFEFVNAGTAGRNKVPVRIVVPNGKTAEAKYAAEVTAEIITRHDEYFGIPYPYEKADQVAVPNTSGFIAMENPGMVTYSHAIILEDPKVDTIGRQRRYLTAAAHELAHQWFGDLVTATWWDDIWLNEAFANWMAQKYVAQWEPEWHSQVGDVNTKLGAESLDSLLTARKIRQPILAKDDIARAFDGITYRKGAAVSDMFENWMGSEEFRKGVQSYLKQYAFRATTAGDFLDSLSSSSKQDVTAAFSTFLNQAGVPVVSVALRCKEGKATLQLDQTRSIPLGSKGSVDQIWKLPLCIRYGIGISGKRECMLMTKASEIHELSGGCPEWVQGNDQAVGYYQVDYKGGLLAALTSGDVSKRLSAAERLDLIGNAQALTAAGKLAADECLALVETFHADPERYVAEIALDLAISPLSTLVPEDLMPNYRRFLLKSFQARARELGWTSTPGDTDDTRLLRPLLVLDIATLGGDQELAAQGKALAEKWLGDHGTLEPDMVIPVLRTATFYGDKTMFGRYLDEFRKTQGAQDRGRILVAMNTFRDPAAIEATRGLLALAFLRSNWDAVVAKMPAGRETDFAIRLPSVGRSYCDAGSRDELKSFFAPRVGKFVGAPRALDQVIEAIDLCIANKAAQGPAVAAFLAKY